ncbi:transposase IS4 family protein [Catenovulum agarivorans DS-2]|uniref:Transposase IS4 family protein n=1 Tax=Catenovulum agarivorans DS-2 TaxID=1328313 RepID=W7Q9I4_9ALTE|nr:transposase IS4 family protein [Catenovulum agarivorans DS-2]
MISKRKASKRIIAAHKAQAWGSVGEQQTLQPAIKQLQNTLTKIQQANSLTTAKYSIKQT